MSVSEDASTPAVATTAGGSTATTIASASFSPPANSVLVAECVINYNTSPATFPTLTVTDSASGTWTIGAPQVGVNPGGVLCAIFSRPVTTAPGAITVTLHRGTDNTAAMLMLAVRVADGANVSSPQGAKNTSSSTTTNDEITITPTTVGSMFYLCGAHSNTQTNTAVSGTTIIQSTADNIDGGMLTAAKFGPITTLTSTTMGWTWASGSQAAAISALEIVPATSTPKISTLTDTFPGSTLNATNWFLEPINDPGQPDNGQPSGTITISGNQLSLSGGTASVTGFYTSVDSQTHYDLTGSAAFVQLFPNTSNSDFDTGFGVFASDFSNGYGYGVTGGNLYVQKTTSGAFTTLNSVAYNATSHAWLKISEASGTISFFASVDGINWGTAIFTTTTETINTWSATSSNVQMYYGSTSGSASPTGTGSFKNFNVTPTVTTVRRIMLSYI